MYLLRNVYVYCVQCIVCMCIVWICIVCVLCSVADIKKKSCMSTFTVSNVYLLQLEVLHHMKIYLSFLVVFHLSVMALTFTILPLMTYL